MLESYRIVAKGRVQGVGYRAFVTRMARQGQIKGYVKNQADGSVLIEAEGDSELMKLFINQCKGGPGWAYVSSLDIIQQPSTGFKDFQVKY